MSELGNFVLDWTWHFRHPEDVFSKGTELVIEGRPGRQHRPAHEGRSWRGRKTRVSSAVQGGRPESRASARAQHGDASVGSGRHRAEELGNAHVGHGGRGQQHEGRFLSHCFVPFEFHTIRIFLKFNFFFKRKEFTAPGIRRILHLPVNLGGSFSFSFCNDVN